jgi:aminoglycoside phosphotransferase (APT) family kinase protein
MVELDLDELRRRLASAAVSDVTPLVGGASSLTFQGKRDGGVVVIKVAPPGVEPVAHRDVLHQARIMKALAATRVPVPQVVWEDPGNPPDTPPLFAMSHVEGECVEPLFDACPPAADLVERYRGACRAMAALHSLSPPALGLGGEPVIDPVAEVHRWCDTMRTVDPALVPGWRNVRQELLQRAPKPMAPSVVHGDFRLGNLLVGPSINAVIDWGIWSIGDPRIDAGWFLINCDPDTYQRVPASAGVAPATAELARIYQDELGREVSDLPWFTALACFKSAATWSLIIKHNRRRRSPRAQLEAMAATLPRLLGRALSMLD